MLGSILIPVIVVVVAQQPPPPLVQKSSGWCSPNIANVTGNVTVNCIGVDPRALKRLNAELSRKNLQLADKIREADEWTKRYKELEGQLNKASDDSVLSRQAEEYLHEGELEKAGAVLDQILGSEEKQVDRTAANHYNRGLVFELQFRPVEALPHLEKAYQYRPAELKYGQEYSYVLLKQNDFNRAEVVLLATLEKARQLAKENPAYQSDVAKTLHDLAILYYDTQRMKQAEAAYQEALQIRRELAKTNPATYQEDVASTLNNLGLLYSTTQRMKEAEAAYQEALGILRQLAKANSAAYQPDVATTLNNLGLLYSATQRMKEAEAAYQEALQISRELARTNPAAYQSDVATTLNNLGLLYSDTQRLKEAEAAYQEGLGIFRQLGKGNPATYQSAVATTLNNLAALYSRAQRMKEAEAAYQEALALFRQLAKSNPTAYQPGLAETLNRLAMLHLLVGSPELARAEVEEALSINRQLWNANPEVAGDPLAQSMLLDAFVLNAVHQPRSAICALLREAGMVAYDPRAKKVAADQQAKLCSTP
jgi:tetratricopeptide (TPR) repeat protein